MSLLPNEVKTEHISSGAVTTSKIADESINVAKIKNNAVTTEKMATGAVTGSKIADNAVTGSKIRDGTVRSEKIAAGAITTAKIGEAQVTGSRLQDRAVTSEKLSDNAVTTRKIANGAITPAKLSFTPPAIARPITPAVTTDEIANAAVTPEKLSFSVPTRPMTPPIATAEIGELQVISSKLQNGCVTQEKLAPGVGGDRFVFGTLLTPGLQSAEVLYLTGQAASIPWTVLDISTYVPEGAKAIHCQLGIYTESVVPNSRAELRIRTNVDQRDALGVSNKGTNQSDYNGGVVPLVVTGARTIEYSLDVTGTISVTMWVTIVGYIR